MQEALRLRLPDADRWIARISSERHGLRGRVSDAPCRAGLRLTIRDLRIVRRFTRCFAGIDLHIPAGPVRRHVGLIGLRQEHLAAPDAGLESD